MGILISAGMVDNRTALASAVTFGRKSSVKLLLRQQEGKTSDGGAYVNSHQDNLGQAPLFYALGLFGAVSPRIVRLLVDAGADTRLTQSFKWTGREKHSTTRPWLEQNILLREREIDGKYVTSQQLSN